MKRLFLFMTLITLICVGSLSSSAQDQTVLMIAVPELTNNLPPDLFTDFEEEYGVRVIPQESMTEPYLPHPADGVEVHLDALYAYLQSADVVYVNQYTITPAGTQTGWFLDLAPIASTDSSLIVEDYAAPAWESFQWDGGMWAFPFTFDTLTLAYNPSAFDEAGLTYPDLSWTIQQFADAARALTQRDAGGNVIRPGFEARTTPSELVLALANLTTLADETQFPAAPIFNQPSLADVVQTLAQLQSDGVIAPPQSIVASTVETMTVFYSFEHANNQQAGATLLPGGMAGISVDGYAVSSGTANPDLAYQLAKYISQRADQLPFNLATYYAYSPLSKPPTFSTQAQPILEAALNVAIPYSQVHFADYIHTALSQGGDEAIFQSTEQVAEADLAIAQERGANTSLIVEVPARFLADGVVLRFGTQTFTTPLSNQAQFDAAIESFVNQHDDIANILVEPLYSLQQQVDQLDCYVGSNQIARMDLTTILPLDPLMDTDPNFMPEEFFPGTLDQMEANNQTFGYPIAIVPRGMVLDPTAFENSGISLPVDTWSASQFTDAITQISANSGQPAYAYTITLDMMTLVVAYGGMPMDYSTNPPTPNFADPSAIQAIQQVLDLAVSGSVNYYSLADPMGMVNRSGQPIRTYTFPSAGVGIYDPSLPLVNFPTGSQYVPVSYSTLTGYIRNTTQYPEACYRWLDFISHRPEIYTTMPARRSELDRAEAEALLLPDMVAFMRMYESVLNQPNTVALPYVLTRGENDTAVMQYWLNRAFDHYVLEGMDLEAELQLAQSTAESYLECRVEGASVRDCAIALDPDTSVVFP